MGVNIEFAGIEVCEGDVGREKAVNGRTGGSTGDTGQAPAPILGSGSEELLPLIGWLEMTPGKYPESTVGGATIEAGAVVGNDARVDDWAVLEAGGAFGAAIVTASNEVVMASTDVTVGEAALVSMTGSGTASCGRSTS